MRGFNRSAPISNEEQQRLRSGMTTPTNLVNLSGEKKRALLAQMLREKAGKTGNLPLSFAQQRLWFLDQLEPNSPLYNIATAFRLKGPLNFSALQFALDTIVARHEALRTRFESQGENPVQIIDPAKPVSIEKVDLASLSQDRREAEAEALLSEEARKPFQLSKDALMRCKLFRLGDAEHILVLTIHHIAADEWSLKVLLREFSECYRAHIEGRGPELPDLTTQYPDFARWQIESFPKTSPQHLDYWKKHLEGHSPGLDISTDRPRGNAQTSRGASRSRALNPDLTRAVERISREEQATPFMTLLAAFNVLMHRYTRQNDLVIGSPISGRTRLETENLIGFFVNTLALRTRIEDQATFRQILRQVRETTLEAYTHQDLPFEKVVEALHPERSTSHAPFLQAVFTSQTDLVSELSLPGLTFDFWEIETGTAKFDLTLIVKEGRQLQAFLEYKTDLFDHSTAERLLGHYEMLLEQLTGAPDEKISRARMLLPSEEQQILVDWNKTSTEYPSGESIHSLVAQQALRTPGAVAVEYGKEKLTYAELDLRANQLAHYLLSLGVRKGQLVGLCVERSPSLIVGMLGILKAGAAYVPLDPGYPGERLALMIQDTKMRVLVTEEKVNLQISANDLRLVSIGAERRKIEQQPKTAPLEQVDSADLAYVIYTSGSTGKPKGVSIPHRGVTRLVCNTNYIQLGPEDRVAQASTPSFDAATFEIWGPLLTGGRIVGISKDITLSPIDFAAQIRERQITTLFLTTALFNQLASEAPDAFATVKQVLFGGEAVDPKWVRAILNDRGPRRLLHVYGPTENTTFSTWFEIKNVSADATTIPIGRPLSNSTAYVLDSHANPVPIGVPGELYVGGDGLAKEYLERPEVTREKFVAHPWIAGELLYRTGDLVRLREDGAIEFIGRIDNQVKIRGFRIELGEIEAVLAQHPAVRETVVLAREDTPGERKLAAYLVAPGEGRPAEAELRAYLKNRLPDYMVPSAFVFLDSMPLTPNEKIDRKALPAPAHTRDERTFVAPRNTVEQQLAKIFEKTLGVQPVGVTDNFFDLGGHSLLAVRLFSQIEKIFNKKLPLATLFKAPTIQQLAHELRSDSDEKWSTIVDIQPEGSKPPIFWIHSLGGDGGGGFFYYRRLAALLGADQPSFGIRSPREPFDRIEAMATYYIKEIRELQPHGPYYLGGFCFGGNVAFEIGRQLEQSGEKVGMLIVMESSPPNVHPETSWTGKNALYSLESFFTAVSEFMQLDPSERKNSLKRKGQKIKKRMQRKFSSDSGEPTTIQLSDMMDMSQYPKDYVKYAETHWAALKQYYPGKYSGEIYLYRVRKQPLSSLGPTLGWENLAPGKVRVKIIGGTHETMMQDPNVQELARDIQLQLQAVQKDAAQVESEDTEAVLCGT
jgi:amino acid adenylation domain-containing protein